MAGQIRQHCDLIFGIIVTEPGGSFLRSFTAANMVEWQQQQIGWSDGSNRFGEVEATAAHPVEWRSSSRFGGRQRQQQVRRTAAAAAASVERPQQQVLVSAAADVTTRRWQ